MNAKTPLRLFALGFILISPSLSSAQEARILMPPAVRNQAYSQSIPETLREKYHVTLKSSSPAPAFQWRLVGVAPAGLGVMPTGEVVGTPAVSRLTPYLFSVEVSDRSLAQPAPLRFQLSLQVLTGEAPVLVPVEPTPTVPTGGKPTPGTGDVTISPIAGPEGVKDVPSVDPYIVVLKKSGIKKLLVEVRNNGQSVDRQDLLEVKDLNDTQGIVSPQLKVAVGTNLIRVFDANTMTSQASAEVVCTGKCGKTEAQAENGEKPVGNITILKPTGEQVFTGLVESSIRIIQSDIASVYLQVLNKDKPVKQAKNVFSVNYVDGVAILKPTIRIAKGENKILLYNPNQPADKSDQASFTLNCDGDKCDTGRIEIDVEDETHYRDAYIAPNLTVHDNAIKKVFLSVTNGDKPVPQTTETFEVKDDKPQEIKVRIGPGKNEIKVSDAGATENPAQARLVVYCDGENCSGDIASITTNSLNTRVVVGFEQAGASSADSETKPFLDFFFTGPLRFGKRKEDPLARISSWGQIRFSTTPEQVGAVGAFPSNLANQAAQTAKTVNLVQSFDFLAGLEGRIYDSRRLFPGLIPGVKHRTFLYLVGGGGAISPLSTTRQSAQIFSVPGEMSPQRQLFIDRFGADAAAKKYIAFVFPERDKFLRQYYFGFRFKTFFYDRDENLINRFPAILDVMFGQNEAVTGGRFKNDVTDDAGRIVGKKRSYVMRIDAFYPLPFKEASFLYLYGTAMLKIGGKVQVGTPLFLDTAPGDVLVTSDDVFIAPNLQLNRDYYKVGVGINLTDLFNRKPKN